jgi:hypothetical protein
MAEHLTTEQLLLACDNEAGATAEAHLAGCQTCRERLEEIREGAEEYATYHRFALRTTQPAPPRPWRNLNLPRTVTPIAPPREPYRWMALAAAIIIAVVVIWPSKQTPPLEPSELLSRAGASEQTSSSARRIVIRSSKGTLVRPAVWIRRVAEHPLQPRFQRAGYSWDEPLSVRSYVAWRRTLTRKHDSVRRASHPKTSEPIYVVTTETDSNPLKEATLSLREQDLRPVSGTLRFTDDEVVEMEEGSPEPTAKPEAPSSAAAPSVVEPKPGGPIPAMQQLHVLAALHSVGADLGEPIQMEQENGMVVLSATGISNTRRDQIQKALAGLDFVVQRFEPRRSAPPAAALRTEASSQNQNAPVRVLVEQHLEGSITFEQFVNDALDASDALSSRAHALGALAARFPEPVEGSLPAEGRQLLDSIRRDHVRSATEQVQKLAGLLLNGFRIEGSAPAAPARPWQAHSTAFRDSVQEFDTLLTGTLTGARKAEIDPLREAFSRLKAEFEALASIPVAGGQ